MNKFYAIDVCYLRPSKTIETILLQNEMERRIVYVYNYEGLKYYCFKSIIQIIFFFNNEFEPEIFFETDEELVQYLEELNFNE